MPAFSGRLWRNRIFTAINLLRRLKVLLQTPYNQDTEI